MSFGAILGGALQGIGAGLAAKGRMDMEAQAEAAKQDAIARREAWIESTRHSNRTAEMQTESGLRINEQTNQADLQDRNASRQNARTTASQIAVDNARTANDKALAKFQSNLRMTEDQDKAARELTNQLSLMGQKAERFEIAADGSMVAINGLGKIISKSAPGRFVAPGRASATDDGSDLLKGAGVTRAQPLPTKNVASRPPLASFQQ